MASEAGISLFSRNNFLRVFWKTAHKPSVCEFPCLNCPFQIPECFNGIQTKIHFNFSFTFWTDDPKFLSSTLWYDKGFIADLVTCKWSRPWSNYNISTTIVLMSFISWNATYWFATNTSTVTVAKQLYHRFISLQHVVAEGLVHAYMFNGKLKGPDPRCAV